MPLSQSVEGCLEANIGKAGLSKTALDRSLAHLEPRLASLREAHATNALPLLRVPEWRDDIAAAREALAALGKDARTLVFFGTGGSSLGGQTLAQLGGWGIPGDDGNGGQRDRPRTRFYDNLDARTLERALGTLDLAATRFVVISKSGNTPETLVQTIAAIEAVRLRGSATAFQICFLASLSRAAPPTTACATFATPYRSPRFLTIPTSAAASRASPMSGFCPRSPAGSTSRPCAKAPAP